MAMTEKQRKKSLITVRFPSPDWVADIRRVARSQKMTVSKFCSLAILREVIRHNGASKAVK